MIFLFGQTKVAGWFWSRVTTTCTGITRLVVGESPTLKVEMYEITILPVYFEYE